MEQENASLKIRPSLYFSKIQWLSFALLLLYFIGRFPLISKVDELGLYASYVLESFFVIVVWAIFQKRISFRIRLSMRLALDAAIMLGCGIAIYKFANPFGLVIPFDLRSLSTIVFLLVVAPILEEMIFRMAHWELVSEFVKKPFIILVLTSSIFSFAHFFAWWSVPIELHSFILYQTIYTLGLGWYCGLRRIQTGSITSAIIVHFFFNAGFYIGYIT